MEQLDVKGGHHHPTGTVTRKTSIRRLLNPRSAGPFPVRQSTEPSLGHLRSDIQQEAGGYDTDFGMQASSGTYLASGTVTGDYLQSQDYSKASTSYLSPSTASNPIETRPIPDNEHSNISSAQAGQYHEDTQRQVVPNATRTNSQMSIDHPMTTKLAHDPIHLTLGLDRQLEQQEREQAQNTGVRSYFRRRRAPTGLTSRSDTESAGQPFSKDRNLGEPEGKIDDGDAIESPKETSVGRSYGPLGRALLMRKASESAPVTRTRQGFDKLALGIEHALTLGRRGSGERDGSSDVEGGHVSTDSRAARLDNVWAAHHQGLPPPYQGTASRPTSPITNHNAEVVGTLHPVSRAIARRNSAQLLQEMSGRDETDRLLTERVDSREAKSSSGPLSALPSDIQLNNVEMETSSSSAKDRLKTSRDVSGGSVNTLLEMNSARRADSNQLHGHGKHSRSRTMAFIQTPSTSATLTGPSSKSDQKSTDGFVGMPDGLATLKGSNARKVLARAIETKDPGRSDSGSEQASEEERPLHPKRSASLSAKSRHQLRTESDKPVRQTMRPSTTIRKRFASANDTVGTEHSISTPTSHDPKRTHERELRRNYSRSHGAMKEAKELKESSEQGEDTGRSPPRRSKDRHVPAETRHKDSSDSLRKSKTEEEPTSTKASSPKRTKDGMSSSSKRHRREKTYEIPAAAVDLSPRTRESRPT